MEITVGSGVEVVSLLVIIAKLYHDHMTIKDIKTNGESQDKRVKLLENEVMKIEEALDRTYATEKFVYAEFIHEKQHKQSMIALEEKMIGEMKLINQNLKNLAETIERMNSEKAL